MERRIIVLKLGGSLLTEKSKPFTLREDILEQVAKEIKECIDFGLIQKLVLIHGVGSFGHPPVLEHNLHMGYKNSSQLLHLSKTQLIVNRYRNKIAEVLLDKGIPINLMHASSILQGKKMKIIRYSFSALKGFLSLGMVPLLGGDMMYDKSMGFSVCSGDQLAVLIASQIGANDLIFATDVPGIYSTDPNSDPDAELLTELTINEIEQIINSEERLGKMDASGGIKGKLRSLLPTKILIEKGLNISIITMLTRGTLLNFLKGEIVKITRIKSS